MLPVRPADILSAFLMGSEFNAADRTDRKSVLRGSAACRPEKTCSFTPSGTY
jgi:hypothetical protein